MIKFPKSAGAAIDLLWNLKEQRRALDAQSEAIKEREKALEEYIRANYFNDSVITLTGKTATASVRPSIVPGVTDWDKVYAFIKKTGAFELLHRRISTDAWRERQDAGKPVPGTEPKTVWNFSVKAVKS